MAYSTEERKEIVTAFSKMMIETELSVWEIARKLGCSLVSIYKWSQDDKELMDIRNDGNHIRAWRYIHEAHQVLKDAQCFFTDNKDNVRECNSTINKAKHLSEFLLKLAGFLVPEVFGDLRHEIKAMQKEIAEIKQALSKNKE